MNCGDGRANAVLLAKGPRDLQGTLDGFPGARAALGRESGGNG